ncbi:uncharacterized protein [Hetaerina americana]|uniref:uncharacterized protein isoform X2 n=1 Tax=Hetaerina americana TaxID=62018 RepID=UPI003A7F13E0
MVSISAGNKTTNLKGFNPSSEEDSELDLEDEDEEAGAEVTIGNVLSGSPSTTAAINSSLPDTVTLLSTPDGGSVYLVGTAHFSKESQEDVAQVIRAVQPHVILVELCKARVNILQLDEQTILEEAKNINFDKIKSTIQQNGLFHGIMNILLLSMSAHLTKELGMAPGGEFRRAFSEAKNVPGCVVHLGDRPIKLTLQRALASLSWWQTLKLTWHIMSKESIRGSRAVQAARSARGDAGRAHGGVSCFQSSLCCRERSLLGQLAAHGRSAYSQPIIAQRIHSCQGGWSGWHRACAGDSPALGQGGRECHSSHHEDPAAFTHKPNAQNHHEGFLAGPPCLGLRAHPPHPPILEGHCSWCRELTAHHQGHCARPVPVRHVGRLWRALVQCISTLLVRTLPLVLILVCGFSLVYGVVYRFFWEIFLTCKELDQEDWLGGAGGAFAASGEAPADKLCPRGMPAPQADWCGCTRCSPAGSRGMPIQHTLHVFIPSIHIVFSFHLIKSKHCFECNKQEYLIKQEKNIGTFTCLKRSQFESWSNWKVSRNKKNVLEITLGKCFKTIYRGMVEFLFCVLYNSWDWKSDLCHNFPQHSHSTCTTRMFGLSRKIPPIHHSLNACKMDWFFPRSLNLESKGLSRVSLVNRKGKRSFFDLGDCFDPEGGLPFGGLELDCILRDGRFPVEFSAWVGLVGGIGNGGGGEEAGRATTAGEGVAEGGPSGAEECGKSIEPEQEEPHHFPLDTYEHPIERIFYVPTNVCGPGGHAEDFDSSYSGCDCSLGSLTCAGAGLKCACIARSLGPNYTSHGLLRAEKRDGHHPVLECGDLCGCGVNCGNRRVQFGPLAELQVFDTRAGKEGGGKGLGLRTLASVRQGSFVCEYAGEVIGREEAQRRWKADWAEGKANYILALVEWSKGSGNAGDADVGPHSGHSKVHERGGVAEGVGDGTPVGAKCLVSTYIDPTRIGNIGRYANHSCDPNTVAIGVRIQSPVPHLCLFAAKNLCPGEEVTFDYAGMGKSQEKHSKDDCREEKLQASSVQRKASDLCPAGALKEECDCSNEMQALQSGVFKGVGEVFGGCTVSIKCPSESGDAKESGSASGDGQGDDDVCPLVSRHPTIASPEGTPGDRGVVWVVPECAEETGAARIPCLCGAQNCRKFLPFTGCWI